MKRHAAGLALAGLLAAGPPPGDAIGFHPAEGSAVTKTFHTELAVVLEDVEVFIDGAETDPAAVGIPADVEFSFGYRIACLDRYEAVAGGRPVELLRTFETLEAWSVDPEGEEVRGEPEDVVDRTVRYVWDEDEEAYEASFDDGEGGDEDALELLHENLDLRGLLPGGDVAVGESWEVSGEDLLTVLLPGFDAAGDHGWEDNDRRAVLMRGVRRLGEGAGTCTYRGTEEDDGRTLAAIDFAFTAEDDFELDPGLADVEPGEVVEVLLEVSLDLEVEGRCLWDVASGRFHSFEMEGEGSIVVDAAISLESAGIEGSVELALDLQRTATAR